MAGVRLGVPRSAQAGVAPSSAVTDVTALKSTLPVQFEKSIIIGLARPGATHLRLPDVRTKQWSRSKGEPILGREAADNGGY